MAEVWPLQLPQSPAAASYSEDPANEVLRSDMDRGPAKIRGLGHAKGRIIALEYLFTTEELDAFEDFFARTLQNGVMAFDWWNVRKNKYVRSRFVPGEKSPYHITNKVLYWTVTFTLETFEYAPLP